MEEGAVIDGLDPLVDIKITTSKLKRWASPDTVRGRPVVLVACGSYSPLTNMHLRMFEVARDSLVKEMHRDVIGGFISPVHDAYKKLGLVEAGHRVEMINRALESNEFVACDTWEIEQPGYTRTVLSLNHFERSLQAISVPAGRGLDPTVMADVQVMLLCGSDLLESFLKPGVWSEADVREILGKFGLVCIERVGSDARQLVYESDLLSHYAYNIHFVREWVTNDISSTKIRRHLRRGLSVKYLVPDPVIAYIEEHQLFKA